MSRTLGMIAAVCLMNLTLAAAVGRAQGLEIGDPSPEFECWDDAGHVWKSGDHLGHKLQVVYFYQGDFAFCCTRQAERYQNSLCELYSLDAEVVGISGDSVESHRKFSSEQELDFALLSDGKGEIARKFGVPLRAGGKGREVTAARWTFIIDQDRRVIYREHDVNPIGDTRQVLEFLRHRKGKPVPVPVPGAQLAAPDKPIDPIRE